MTLEERLDALLEQWEKDRCEYPTGDPYFKGAFIAVKICEEELRRAINGP